MRERTALSHDGCTLRYGYCDQAPGKPWIALIIPFGLNVDVARAFFDFFAADYNILTWEARLILEPPERTIAAGELTIGNHVADLFAVLDACNVERATLVGYCSGAGIALAALEASPQRFDDLVLVNGEYTLLKEPSCVTQFGSDIDTILTLASRDLKTAQLILDRMRSILEEMSSGKRSSNGRAPPSGIHVPFSKPHYFHRYALNYLSYRATDFLTLASAVRRRTLLISGESDMQTNVTSSRKIQRCIAGSKLRVEPNGDHYELLRHGSSTLAQVRSFLSASEGGHRA
ncbi:MAG TPA: alpha/beta hydrolase [Steroidobacter sp.]|uniref:alpha/beta fold hydrolase n=1 Tax=Steroidobacter sp. TaxID=1978227 RepID=UPI002EDB43BE